MNEMKAQGLFQTACELRGEQLKPIIRCGGHGWVPYSIVCRHFIEAALKGTRCNVHRVALPADDLREVDYDWLCSKCLAKYKARTLEECDLSPCCIHCMRKVEEPHRPTVRDGQPRTYEILVLDRAEHKDGQAKKGKGAIWHFNKAFVSWVCECCEPSDDFMQGVRTAANVPDGRGLMVDLDVVAESGFQVMLGTHPVKDESGNETTISYLIGQRRL